MFSYQSVLTSPILPCTQETFYEIIRSANVQRVTANIRAKLAEPCDTPEKAKVNKEHAAKMKKLLPAFCFQSTFAGRRRLQKDCKLNGLYMVDFDHLEGDPREWYNAKFNGTSEAIQPTETFGIMLAHITPSGHGLRFVAMADARRGNLADNARWLSGKLGLPLDEACKDATRLSFAFPESELLYINDLIFAYHNEEFEKQFGDQYRQGNSQGRRKDGGNDGSNSNNNLLPAGGGGVPADSSAGAAAQGRGVAAGQPAQSDAPAERDCGKLTYRGVAYSDIIAKYWQATGGEPVEGERNVKLHRLAYMLRYICDNDTDKLLSIMPRYGLGDEEMSALVKSAVGSKMFSSIPKVMRDVLKSLGVAGVSSTADASSDGGLSSRIEQEKQREEIEKEFMARLDTMNLPPFFKAVMSGVPSQVRNGALLASLPMIYTLASRVTFEHFDGTESRLSGMTFVIGPAASGKSFILDLDRILMEPIRTSDKGGRELERQYRESKELNKNKQKQQEQPHPVIRIVPIQISNTMLARRMRDAVDMTNPDTHLHVYSIEAELATAIRAAKGGSWIEKNDIYCKAFHNEFWGMDYANDQAVNGEVEVNLNLVVSGTDDAFEKLIPASTVLSGLPTRLMYYPMPVRRFEMLDRKKLRRSERETTLLRNAAYTLDRARGEVSCKTLQKRMWEWCAKIAKRAEIEMDEELDDLRKRTALIGMRAGVAYALVSNLGAIDKGQEVTVTKDALDFAEYVADYCLQRQYEKFSAQMAEAKRQQMLNRVEKHGAMRLTALYNSLGDAFHLDDLCRQRPTATRKANDMLLRRWESKGLIEKTTVNDKYKKVIKKI